MTPGTPPTWTGSPSESPESVNTPVSDTLSVSDKSALLLKNCQKIEADPEMRTTVMEMFKGNKAQSDVKEVFEKKLLKLSSKEKTLLWITPPDISGVREFMRKTGCFEHQFMYNIEKQKALKDRAKQEVIEECVWIADEEYHLTEAQKRQLTDKLTTEETLWSLKLFLESYKHRRKRISRYLSANPQEKKLDETVNMTAIHQRIAELNPTIGSNAYFQSAWVSMLGGIDVKKGESLWDALNRLSEWEGATKLATNYEKFFRECPDSVISADEKKHILNFLLRRYLPYVTLSELELVSPKKAEEWVEKNTTPEVITDTNIDTEWREAFQGSRSDTLRFLQRKAVISSGIPTSWIDFETKMRLMTQYGHKKRLENIEEHWTGVPGGIATHQDYQKNFQEIHGFHPSEINTQSALVKKLDDTLNRKIKNIQNFVPGSVMTWTTKNPDGSGMMTGYYVIDGILSESIEDDALVQMRFVGNNLPKNDPNTGKKVIPKISLFGGVPRNLTGSRFFEYVNNCTSDENGEIDFIAADAIENKLKSDGIETYSDEDAYSALRKIHGETKIPNRDILDKELDILLQDDEGKKRESKNEDDRKIFEGMTFAVQGQDGIDTFQIEEINEVTGEITLWDGWGLKKKDISKDTSRQVLSYSDFLNVLKWFKEKNKICYRLPIKANAQFGVEEFNTMMALESTSPEGRYKYNQRIQIHEGKLVETNQSGGKTAHSIVKVWPKKDLEIERIEGNKVMLRIGTFKQISIDKKAQKINKQASFVGSGVQEMPLSWLWAYLQTHSARLESPPKKGDKYYTKPKEQGDMNWWNIFCHAHSFGTLLHGDLWNGPWKAFEEQHHKDHAFAGKITAALAIEKMQRMPGGNILFDHDWANIMVWDANSSFQSYLDELVNKIDSMGSHHRTRIIKKWSKLHFPDPKFMVAMMASMKIFGQLYPYDDGEKDVRRGEHGKDWFWYNSIMHSSGIAAPDGWPHHMPPHGEGKWPKNSEGNEITEVEACYELFSKFKHPLLANLGRRFQKYMQKWHEELKDGGKGNLEQRSGMEDKLDWMMGTVCHSKISEAFWEGTKIWLGEWYPTEITTMPYAAMMFGGRDQQLMPNTQTHLKDLFWWGTHMPMFVFAQNKNMGDIFRKTWVAFAHTISPEAGKWLEWLVKQAEHRLHKDTPDEKGNKWKWRDSFQDFWRAHGAEMMHKLTGMRDPMLNLMINAPDTFEEMLKDMPESKRAQYKKLRENKDVIKVYHSRLRDQFWDPQHAGMKRGDAFYSGNHFRFRDQFDVWYPIAWLDWDSYLDANLDKNYAAGSAATDWDGIYNELRGFINKIPKMAETMVEQMGFTEGNANREKYINSVSKQLFEKNRAPMQRLAQKFIKATNPEAEYCSMHAMMMGIVPLQELASTGASVGQQKKYTTYHVQMQKVLEKAEQIEREQWFAEAIKYRAKMAEKWSIIVKGQMDTEKMSLEDLENIGSWGNKKQLPVAKVQEETLTEFEKIIGKKHTPWTENAKEREKKQEDDSAFPVNASSVVF
jgi:hypothetical protein